MKALLLHEVYQCPDFMKIHGRRHFHGHVLAMLQGAAGHGEVMDPVSGNVNQVEVVAGTELLIAFLAVLDGGTRHGSLLQGLLAGIGALDLIVAQGYHLNAGDVGPAFHGVAASHAQTHKAYAHNR